MPVLPRRHARSREGLLCDAAHLVGDNQEFRLQPLHCPLSVAEEVQVLRLQLCYRPLPVASGFACDLCVFSHRQRRRFFRHVFEDI